MSRRFATELEPGSLLKNLGEAETTPASGGLVEMRVALPPETHADSPLRGMLRKAAGGRLWVRLLGRRDAA